MKRVLSADLFEFRKSKMTYILPAVSVLVGILLPMMYYGLIAMLKYLGSLEILQDQSYLSSFDMLVDTLNAKAVFLSVLPVSQGIGIAITAMVGFRSVRPFSTGIYRNKVIAGIPRSHIYLSQSLFSLILTMVSAALYTASAAVTTMLTFGDPDLSGREITVIVLLSLGIYLVYTAIPVFTAFLTRSLPLTIIISIILPILLQTVVSFISPALMSAPRIVTELLSIIPSFQGIYMMGASASDSVLLISMISDICITAVLTVLGILRFRKSDIN